MNTDVCLSDADLGRLSEGDLSRTERAAFEHHVEACSPCRARWERVAAGARYVADQ